MKKLGFIAVIFILSLVVPGTVYAYNNFNTPSTNNDTFNDTFQNRRFNGTMHGYMMGEEYAWFHDQVNVDFDCFNEAEHDQFVEEIQLKIEQKLENNELTEEEATQLKDQLEEMLEHHNQFHQDEMIEYHNRMQRDNNNRRNCH